MLLSPFTIQYPQPPFCFRPAVNTSSSSFSMTSSTKLRLSMKPLTATRSMRFVVATYLTLRMLFSWVSAGATADKVRRTSGESSLSTPRACSAMDASRAVGKGTLTVLQSGAMLVYEGIIHGSAKWTHKAQGNSCSAMASKR